MAEIVKTLLTQILLRNDTETNWSSVNPVLGKGEIAISIDKNQFKIGDGESNWSALSYFEGNLATKVANLEAELYGEGTAADSRLDQLASKVNALEVTGGQANVLEVVKVKDEEIVTFDAATKTATIDLGAYAKSAALSSYATTEYVNNELKSYATTNALTEAIKDFVTDGELAETLADYVTLEAYNLKVAALEDADAALGARIDAIYKKEGEEETGVLMDKLTAVNNTIEGLSFYTKDEIDGKVQTINSAIDGKVAQSDYNTKVGELVAEDQRIAGLVATEKERAEGAEGALQTAINDANAKFDSYETKTVAEGKYLQKTDAESTYLKKADAETKYETIAEANKVRDRVTAVEEAINGTGEGAEHQPGLTEKVQANANAISALQAAQAGGLVREIITPAKLAELVAAPSTAADNVIYMVPNQGAGTGEANDFYDEYIKVQTSADPATYAMEFLGDTEVDLSQYYTKTEIADLDYATTEYVDTGLAKKVDSETYAANRNDDLARLGKVETKLSDIAEGQTVKAVIDAAVKVEKDRAELAETGLGNRIKAIEDQNISTTYATKGELQAEATTRSNADDALSGRIKAIEDKGLADGSTYATEADLTLAENRITALEGKVDVDKVSEAISTAVAGEKTLREQADQTLQNNIDAEKARIDTLVGKTEESAGDAGKSVREIAEEVHEANEFIKSVDAGLSVDSEGKLSFAEGVFVLDGGNASNRPTQTVTE